MGKREDTFLAWIYIASREMGPVKMQDRIQIMFPRGKGWRPRSPERGTTNPWTQSPESVRSSVEEIEDKVPCRDTYPFEGNWVKENTGSGVEGTLIWTEDRAPHQEWGRIGDNSAKSHQKGESHIRLSRKGSGGNSHSHPRGLRTSIASWRLLS